jgi:hypothetical protein
MSPYRLLIDFEVVEQFFSLSRSTRTRLHRCFLEVHADPSGLADYTESDSIGRPVFVHICCGFAVKYWLDHADKHIKILELIPADRGL